MAKNKTFTIKLIWQRWLYENLTGVLTCKSAHSLQSGEWTDQYIFEQVTPSSKSKQNWFVIY